MDINPIITFLQYHRKFQKDDKYYYATSIYPSYVELLEPLGAIYRYYLDRCGFYTYKFDTINDFEIKHKCEILQNYWTLYINRFQIDDYKECETKIFRQTAYNYRDFSDEQLLQRYHQIIEFGALCKKVTNILINDSIKVYLGPKFELNLNNLLEEKIDTEEIALYGIVYGLDQGWEKILKEMEPAHWLFYMRKGRE